MGRFAAEFKIPFERLRIYLTRLQEDESLYDDQMNLVPEYKGRLVWLHNQLAVLVKTLDHDLTLPSESTEWNQNELQDAIDNLVAAKKTPTCLHCTPMNLTAFEPENPGIPPPVTKIGRSPTEISPGTPRASLTDDQLLSEPTLTNSSSPASSVAAEVPIDYKAKCKELETENQRLQARLKELESKTSVSAP